MNKPISFSLKSKIFVNQSIFLFHKKYATFKETSINQIFPPSLEIFSNFNFPQKPLK